MRASLKSAVAASLAALTLALAVTASPAEAKPWPKPWIHHGFGPAGLVLGIAGLALAADVAAQSCIEYRPIYDSYGNYLGRERINVCQ